MHIEQCIGREDGGGIALRAKHQDAELGFIEAQMQHRVVQLARHREQPEIGTGSMNSGNIGR